MVQSRVKITEMNPKFDEIINRWKASADSQASDDDIKTVNDLSQALQPSKHKADREHLRNQLMDVIKVRRDMLYLCPKGVNNIDDYLQVLKTRMEDFLTFCSKLKELKAVQGKGSGKDGKKHVMELLEWCIEVTSFMLEHAPDGGKIFLVAA